MEIGQLITKHKKRILLLSGIIIFTYFNPAFIIKRHGKKIFREQFTAVVENKYFNKKDRRKRFIELRNIESDKLFNYFTMNNNEKIFELVEAGDTIVKFSNSYEINIINASKKITVNTAKNRY